MIVAASPRNWSPGSFRGRELPGAPRDRTYLRISACVSAWCQSSRRLRVTLGVLRRQPADARSCATFGQRAAVTLLVRR